jgi:hypothetical protein
MPVEVNNPDFDASCELGRAMMDVVKDAQNVGQGVDAIGMVLGFYLHELREAGVITADDAIELVGIVRDDVLASLASSALRDPAGVH